MYVNFYNMIRLIARGIDIDLWYRIDTPEIGPHRYAGLMFLPKGTKAIQWRKDSSFNKQIGSHWTATGKKT